MSATRARRKHREFAMASGEMSETEFTNFLTTAFRNMAEVSVDGAIHFLCMDWRHIREMEVAGREGLFRAQEPDRLGEGQWRHGDVLSLPPRADLRLQGWDCAAHTNTFELGQHGRYRTNVWQYKGVNTMRKGRMEELSLHPTVKPVQMIADAIAMSPAAARSCSTSSAGPARR
jgi:hypothetical protein